MRQRISSYSKGLKVFDFNGSFLNYKNCFVKITSVTGHIYSRDFPDQYKNWEAFEPSELFDVDPVRKEANPDMNMRKHLENEAEGCNFLVLWLDNDREGENICFEVIDICEKFLKPIS